MPGKGRHSHSHTHTYDYTEPSYITTGRGIWAVKWSFAGLIATSAFQLVIVVISGSVALLADTVHNIGDAATALPLWVAFRLARRRPSKRFTYGYGRVEDMAGIAIVTIIFLSALAAGYEALERFFRPAEVKYLGAVAAASLVGFAGNEAVAIFRIRVGREIRSAALVADGHHARVDGLTSLAVLLGAGGVWLGYPLADPLVGLAITGVIFMIVRDSAKTVFVRLLDGVDPEVVEEIRHAASHVEGVHDVTDVRVRWVGHWLHAEVNLSTSPEISVQKAHDMASDVRHQLLHRLPSLSNAVIHIDPSSNSGERHHRIPNHAHDDISTHSH
jgi:cation diffusion facilitator family transporter